MTFAEADAGKTKLTMRMVFTTSAERDDIAQKYGAVEGLQQTLRRLADYLVAVA